MAAKARWDGPTRKRWLFVIVLLALASALVPALFPAGSIMGRAHGSAFDPTTNTVTLRVRSESQHLVAAKADSRAGRSKALQPSSALPSAPPLEKGRLATLFVLIFVAFSPIVLTPARRVGIALPRAPPASIFAR
ncbi:MAG: hypothetical protein J7498_07275 [Sphingobium sp.]|nr:hypothetical protein [Sphingobium sp.]